jgi:hypothetical protein
MNGRADTTEQERQTESPAQERMDLTITEPGALPLDRGAPASAAEAAPVEDDGSRLFQIGVVVAGVVLLMRSAFGLDLLAGWNWWAVFILIPAVLAFSRAEKMYRQCGTLDAATRSVLMGGMFPFVIALIFLLELDWGRVWPIFVILAGLGGLWGRPRSR